MPPSVTGGGSQSLPQDEALESGAVGQVLRADGLPGAYVDERGADPLGRQAVLLGPGEPVDGELEGVGGRDAVGLPVDDLIAAGVRVLVDRVNAAADHPTDEVQLEGCLDAVGGA